MKTTRFIVSTMLIGMIHTATCDRITVFSPPGYPEPKFLCMFSAVSSSTHSLKARSLVT